MAGFQELIDLIIDGEAVRAATPNRPLRQLDGNIRYLKDLLETALLGQANFIREATVEEDVNDGQPVAWNSNTLQYEQAIGTVDVDPLTGFFKTSLRSNIAGIIYRKLTSTKADILVSGFAEVNLDNAIAGDILPGIYYLSNATAGKLTPVLPPSGVPVLQVLQEGDTTGTWQVLIKQQFFDFLNNHQHYSYELTASPAGSHAPPTAGARHTIVSADSSLEGWLPADDAIFDGKAPANARFGYNLSVTPLAAIWPPVPLGSASVSARKDNIYANDAEPVLQGAETLTDNHVVIDENGIWWMTDCYNEVPWPTNLNTGTEESVSISVGANDCPVTNTDRLFLHWTQSQFFTDQTAVLSLKGREGSGLVFYCRGTDVVKEAGHLEVDFDLNLLLDKTNEPGHIVFKTFESGKFNRGPVVESIKSNSPYLTVTSDASLGADGQAHANIVLDATLDITASEFPIDTVRLNGTEEEFYEDVLAIGFPANRAADFRGRCVVPGQVPLPSGTKLKFRFWVLARATGTIPSNVFTLTYRRITQPSGELVLGTLPTSETSLTLDPGTAISEDEYFYVDSESFTIAAGDDILFTLARAAPDSFSGELHILKMRGIPVAGS